MTITWGCTWERPGFRGDLDPLFPRHSCRGRPRRTASPPFARARPRRPRRRPRHAPGELRGASAREPSIRRRRREPDLAAHRYRTPRPAARRGTRRLSPAATWFDPAAVVGDDALGDRELDSVTPCPGGLVVEERSKIRDRFSSEMPALVLELDPISPRRSRERSVSVPRPSIARGRWPPARWPGAAGPSLTSTIGSAGIQPPLVTNRRSPKRDRCERELDRLEHERAEVGRRPPAAGSRTNCRRLPGDLLVAERLLLDQAR